jgi:CBS domain-containing protein
MTSILETSTAHAYASYPDNSGPASDRTQILAKHIMTRDVTTVGLHTSVRDIARLLSEHRFGAVPVVEDRKVVGIVTEGDLLRRRELGTAPEHCALDPNDDDCAKSQGGCAHDVMTSNVIAVSPEVSLVEIARTMESGHIKHVPVINDDRLVGIISRADIVRALVERPDESQGPLVCDDDVLRYRVIETLMGIRGASAWLTRVSVSKGVVELSGTVEDETVREPSRRTIEALPCIAAVNDRRCIMQPY